MEKNEGAIKKPAKDVAKPRGVRSVHPSLENAVQKLGYANYEEYLKSDHWQDIRRRWRETYGYRCPCGSTLFLHLHHKTYKRLGKEELEDLIYLCRSCHHKEHRKKKPAPSLQARRRAAKAAETRKSPWPSKRQAESERRSRRREEREVHLEQDCQTIMDGLPKTFTDLSKQSKIPTKRLHGAIDHLKRQGVIYRRGKTWYRCKGSYKYVSPTP
jgi:hypothetical protein